MTRTLLFADNEQGIRNYCRHELEAAGYLVLLAADGLEAMDVLDACAVDLAILDEHMPRCGGMEIAKRIKQSYPRLPIILFTADEDYDGYSGPLVDAAMIKSEDLGALKAKIAELLPPPQGTGLLPRADSHLVGAGAESSRD